MNTNFEFNNSEIIKKWLKEQEEYTYPSAGYYDNPAKKLSLAIKWQGLLQRYLQAREFFNKSIECTRIKHNSSGKIDNTTYFECSTIFYNIVVELSWQIPILVEEFAYWGEQAEKDITSIDDIPTAQKFLSFLEQHMQNPNSKEMQDLVEYFKRINNIEESILKDTTAFWTPFMNNNIRYNYNYIKHRGVPVFFESEEKKNESSFELCRCSDKKRYLVDANDLKGRLVFSQELISLYNFDNELLFPYIKKLYELYSHLVD